MSTITISTCQHRGKLCLRAYVNRKPHYRVVKNSKRIEPEKQAWLLELLADRPKLTRRTLAEHLADWHADLLAAGRTQQHADHSRFRVERLCKAANVSKPNQITSEAINRAIAGLRRQPRKRGKSESAEREFSQQTRNHYLTTIKAFLNWLIRNRRLAGPNPLADLRRKLVTDVSQQRYPRDRFQPDELVRLLAATERSQFEAEAIPGPERAMLYRLAAVTGFRRGELAALRPSSFVLDGEPLVRVLPAYTKDSRLAEQPLPDDHVPLLREWLASKPDELLFPGLRDKDAAKMIAWDCEAAGIPLRTTEGKRAFHSLRNSYISMLAESCPLALTQRLARHKDVRLTARYYRPKTDAERAAVNGLPKLGPEQAPKPKVFRPNEPDVA